MSFVYAKEEKLSKLKELIQKKENLTELVARFKEGRDLTVTFIYGDSPHSAGITKDTMNSVKVFIIAKYEEELKYTEKLIDIFIDKINENELTIEELINDIPQNGTI